MNRITIAAIRASNHPHTVEDATLLAFYALHLRAVARRSACVARASDLRQRAALIEASAK